MTTSFDNATESGTVTLGPSFNNPTPQVNIQNLNGRSWLTLENTLALPILVNQISSGSGLVIPSAAGLQIPPFTRCTIPIDPTGDVLLNCLGNDQMFPMTKWDGVNPFPVFAFMQFGTFAQKQIQYMLHDDGSMFQMGLYPNLIPLGGSGQNVNANSAEVFYVSPNASLGASTTWLWPASVAKNPVNDPTIMAVSVILNSFNGADPENVAIRPCYDFDSVTRLHTSFTQAISPFVLNGQMVTFKCPGAIAVAVQNFDSVNGAFFNIIAWVAIPGQ